LLAGVLFFILAFLGLQVFSIHPGIIVILFLTYGAFHFKLKRKAAREKDKGVSAS